MRTRVDDVAITHLHAMPLRNIVVEHGTSVVKASYGQHRPDFGE
jgi:hypothetical protein